MAPRNLDLACAADCDGVEMTAAVVLLPQVSATVVARSTEAEINVQPSAAAFISGNIFPAGPAGVVDPDNVEEWVAGEDISALKVVRAAGSRVFVQDVTDIADMHGCVGISRTFANELGVIEVISNGLLSDASWNFSQGAVFLGLNGSITQSVPSQAFDLRLGTAISATEIFIQLERPIKL